MKAQDPMQAVGACKQALDMSVKAGDLTSSDQLGRMDALQLYGHALLLAGRPEEALSEENRAIDESKKMSHRQRPGIRDAIFLARDS